MPSRSASPFRMGLTAAFVMLVASSTGLAEQWKIPLGGNAFPSDASSSRLLERDGVLSLRENHDRFSVFFRVDRAASLKLALEGSLPSKAVIVAQLGKDKLKTNSGNSELERLTLGEISVNAEGYQRVDLVGSAGNREAAKLTHLIVDSDTPGLDLSFVRNNQGNMFYWGRRGPSVHLRYQLPRSLKLTHAYTEITVPKGQDPIGTFYMANGFAHGYFGFQVNSPSERRILFSVWSPFKTDDPREIPKDQRITALAKGEGVHVGKFGNEGSGGQSYLIYPWKAGTTYRFLTEIKPDGDGRTIYTSWFGDKSTDEWRLIASFRRPKTNTHLRGFHSFLESFSPVYGHIGRRAWYGNVWVRDTNEQWHECTQARLSVDATGRGGHRLDFAGGAQGEQFFMRNCGFFDETVFPDQNFARLSTPNEQPQIAFDELPRGDPQAH
ncbi:MAG: DUF3472 domain-containing protein [Planctomycetota bacterium]